MGGNDRNTIKVLVTGFGPFPRLDGSTYTRNASHEITKLLPSHLEPHTRFNTGGTHVELVNPTAAEGAHVRVEYAHIRHYTADLHDSVPDDVDLIVHVGMADGWDFVSVERRAYKQTFTSSWGGRGGCNRYYRIRDAEGKTVDDAGVCPWGDEVPVGLCTGLDVDDLVDGARRRLGNQPLRQVMPHEDPGAYCCGFIYYESLANKFTKNTSPEILFCHVPGALDPASLEAGADAICAIIGTAASQLQNRRALRIGAAKVAAASASQAMEPMAMGVPQDGQTQKDAKSQGYAAVRFDG